jgi:hypothetical protein
MRISRDTFLSVPFLKVSFLFLCITSSATRGIGAVRRQRCGQLKGEGGTWVESHMVVAAVPCPPSPNVSRFPAPISMGTVE